MPSYILCVTSRALLLARLLVLLAACESSGTSTNSGTASKAVSTPKPSASAEPGISAFLAYAHGASFGTKDFASSPDDALLSVGQTQMRE